MAMKYRLDAIADMRCDDALRIAHAEALADGVVTPGERRVIAALRTVKQATRAARVAGSLALCITTGVDIGPYFDQRLGDYRAAVDELPDAAA
jgi:hypothetical protein